MGCNWNQEKLSRRIKNPIQRLNMVKHPIPEDSLDIKNTTTNITKLSLRNNLHHPNLILQTPKQSFRLRHLVFIFGDCSRA